MRAISLIVGASLTPLLPGVGIAQQPAPNKSVPAATSAPTTPAAMCTTQREAVQAAADNAKKIVQKAMEDANQDTQTEKNDMDACAQGYITMEKNHFALDIPEFRMVNQTISLDLPQVTMKPQHIIFGTPSVKCENVQTGEYPEFTCDHAVIPACTTKWSPIITTVCKPILTQQDIVTNIPEFVVARTSMVIGVPEVTMKRQDWYFDLPKLHLESGCIGSGCAERCQSTANKYQTKYQSIISPAISKSKTDVATANGSFFQCEITGITAQRDSVVAQIDAQIAIVNGSIATLNSMGATDEVKTVTTTLSNLQLQKQKIIDTYETILKGLRDNNRTTTGSVTSSPS